MRMQPNPEHQGPAVVSVIDAFCLAGNLEHQRNFSCGDSQHSNDEHALEGRVDAGAVMHRGCAGACKEQVSFAVCSEWRHGNTSGCHQHQLVLQLLRRCRGQQSRLAKQAFLARPGFSASYRHHPSSTTPTMNLRRQWHYSFITRSANCYLLSRSSAAHLEPANHI